MQIESVSLLEVIAAARARRASIVPETAGYVMLGLGRAMAGVPMRLDLERILLNTEGVVSIEGAKQAVPPAVALRALQQLLAALLDLSTGSAPALRGVVGRPSTEVSTDAFFTAIAKALIPINRSAAKRSLARLARETARVRQSVTLERPSIVLETGDRSSVESAPPPARTRSREAPDVVAEHPTPSPAAHGPSLTPTSLDAGQSAGDRGPAADVAPTRRDGAPAEGQGRRPSEPAAPPKAAAFSALDILDRHRTGAEAAPGGARADEVPAPRRTLPRKEKVVATLGDLGPAYTAASVESLLDRFESGGGGNASLRLLERSLGELGSAQMTPEPGSSASQGDEGERDSTFEDERHPGMLPEAPDEALLEGRRSLDASRGSLEPSRLSSTPSGQSLDRGIVSAPSLYQVRRPGRSRSLLAAASLLVLGGASLGGVAVMRPELLGRRAAAARPAEPTVAEVTLKNLPESHEVLVRVGMSGSALVQVPRGVRLEFVVTAPDHRPRRLVVERDADWPAAGLDLSTSLEVGGPAAWPSAPAGDVGGTGPIGAVRFQPSPASAELWLVLAAGEGTTARVTLPVAEPAHLLVVDTGAPIATPRRFDLDVELLRAAARSDRAEVVVQP